MAQPLGDDEKGVQSTPDVQSSSSDIAPGDPFASNPPASKSGNIFSRLNERLTALNLFESRGIERVPLHERHDVKAADYLQMSLLWFSTNITANNMALGMLGPLSFSLGLVDSALCATFGALVGAAGVAYMGTFGPTSGNRTMVSLIISWKEYHQLTRNRLWHDTSWVTTQAGSLVS
jgi:hypothetical protein